MKMNVTLQMIADELEMSKATVSRALRGDPLIRPATRAQVNEMALRLGYQGRSRSPHHHTKKGTSATLGLLVQALSLSEAQKDSNLVRTMQGVMAEAENNEEILLIHAMRPGTPPMEGSPKDVPPMIREHSCQAVLVRGMAHARDVAYLAAQLPVVSIGRIYREYPADAVVADDVGGVISLVSRLVELGHRRLTWVDAHYPATFLEARQSGFIQGCLRHGLDLREQQFLGPEIYERGRIVGIDSIMDCLRQGATALLCGNDSIALQVILAVESQGVCVPDDVSVTGFDGWQAALDGRKVTSVDPNFSQIGRAAVRLATQRIRLAPTPPCVVSVRAEIVEGDTAGPVPS